jgi:hypothetical protein
MRNRIDQVTLLALLCCVGGGCSDYDIAGKGEPDVLPPDEPVETTPPEPEPEPEPSCDDVPLDGWAWMASPAFATEPDPMDGMGRAFWEVGFDGSGFAPVVLPDTAVPVGMDRAYRAEIELSEVPLDLSLNLQSDDGIEVWVNGTFVGQWGGPWQEEGCVNENAQCLVTTNVPPVSVTDLVVPGANVIAARVSNAIANAYFEVIPECIPTP